MKNEDKKWCVYIHTSPSNKVYIGITCDVKKNPTDKSSNKKEDSLREFRYGIQRIL